MELKPCPFCGKMPKMFGAEIRDFVDGEWAQATRREFWVKPFCNIACTLGKAHSRAYGVIGGIMYKTPEAAAEAWNRRANDA